MIKVLPTTPEQVKYYTRNLSQMLSDDQWYSMVEELGFINETFREGWSLKEVFELVQEVSICGTSEFATIHDFQAVFNKLAIWGRD